MLSHVSNTPSVALQTGLSTTTPLGFAYLCKLFSYRTTVEDFIITWRISMDGELWKSNYKQLWRISNFKSSIVRILIRLALIVRSFFRDEYSIMHIVQLFITKI